jgi:hypothetical protein
MKNATKIVTFGIIPLFFLLVLVFDVVAMIDSGTEASISSLIITTAYKMPFMVYSVGLINGVLAGHLFWRMKPNKDTINIDSPSEVKK